jgi:pantetheine-phosphate adenylyltransferase
MRVAIYPGSFDPWTEGHQDVLRAALGIFDRVVVAVLQNPDKHPMFTLDQRLGMIGSAIGADLDVDGSRVQIVSNSHDLAVNVARAYKADWMIRGLRLGGEYEKELAASLVNASLDAGVQTVYIPPLQHHIHISSTVVRQLLGFKATEMVEGMVPESVYDKIVEYLGLR